jgi:hypothetical protein
MIKLVQKTLFLRGGISASTKSLLSGSDLSRAAVSEMGRAQHSSGRMETAGPQPKVGQEPRMPDHPWLIYDYLLRTHSLYSES